MPDVGQPVDPVQALYRSVVLEHYRRPRNRDPLPAPDGEATVHNPVCGDQVRVEVGLDGARISEVSARARGCSIAVAAASVMSELVGGADAAGAARLAETLERIVAGEPAPPGTDERLRAFAGVAPHRSRHRCATLAWEALAEALGGVPEPSSGRAGGAPRVC